MLRSGQRRAKTPSRWDDAYAVRPMRMALALTVHDDGQCGSALTVRRGTPHHIHAIVSFMRILHNGLRRQNTNGAAQQQLIALTHSLTGAIATRVTSHSPLEWIPFRPRKFVPFPAARPAHDRVSASASRDPEKG